jgi:hypothetical protein
MTKIEAIKKVIKANDGLATLEQIYKQITKYKRDAKQASNWKAGIRGVINRELPKGKHFKRVYPGTYSVIE